MARCSVGSTLPQAFAILVKAFLFLPVDTLLKVGILANMKRGNVAKCFGVVKWKKHKRSLWQSF